MLVMEKFASLFKDFPDFDHLSCLKSHAIDNPDNSIVNCQHPVIIRNPILGQLLSLHKNYTALGVTRFLSDDTARCYAHYLPKRFFNPHCITLSDLNDYFITDYSSGEVFPMFIAVPCGHCDICKSSKVDSFAHRCELETQCYNHLPYFITLTYDELHYPDKGPRVEDAQLFIKRLRSRLSYAGWNDRFRYVVVSEYGYNTHRGHLHMLVWNLYPTREIRYTKIRRFVRESWQNGFIYMSIVSPGYKVKGNGHFLAKPEHCFKYVAKYICKDCVVPDGFNRTFVNTSRRDGGIGAPFLDRHAKYIRRNRNLNIKYLDQFTGKLKCIQMCRYNLNRLFPTYSQSVPLELRNAVKEVCKASPHIKHFDSFMSILQESIGKHVYFPKLEKSDLTSSVLEEEKGRFDVSPGTCSIGMHEVWKNIQTIIKYKDFDFERCRKLANDRAFVIAKFFEHKEPRQFAPIVLRLCKERDLARQREVF